MNDKAKLAYYRQGYINGYEKACKDMQETARTIAGQAKDKAMEYTYIQLSEGTMEYLLGENDG